MSATPLQSIALERNGFASFQTHLNQRLSCLEGELWVTQEGVLRDYILEAGDTLEIGCEASIALSALRPSRYRVIDAACVPCQSFAAPRLVNGDRSGLRGVA